MSDPDACRKSGVTRVIPSLILYRMATNSIEFPNPTGGDAQDDIAGQSSGLY